MAYTNCVPLGSIAPFGVSSRFTYLRMEGQRLSRSKTPTSSTGEGQALANNKVIGQRAVPELRPFLRAQLRACAEKDSGFAYSRMARSLEMAFTADEVAELFQGGENVLDGFCMEDSDDDLGMNEEEGIDLASEFDNFEGMLGE